MIFDRNENKEVSYSSAMKMTNLIIRTCDRGQDFARPDEEAGPKAEKEME